LGALDAEGKPAPDGFVDGSAAPRSSTRRATRSPPTAWRTRGSTGCSAGTGRTSSTAARVWTSSTATAGRTSSTGPTEGAPGARRPGGRGLEGVRKGDRRCLVRERVEPERFDLDRLRHRAGPVEGRHVVTRSPRTRATSPSPPRSTSTSGGGRARNPIWDTGRRLLDPGSAVGADPGGRGEALANLGTQTEAERIRSVLPPEGEFLAILVDALRGNDRITVGPTVQKTVWIDAGPGDDRVEILSGTPSCRTRARTWPAACETTPGSAPIPAPASGQPTGRRRSRRPRREPAAHGLTIDSPDDVDWYAFRLDGPAPSGATLKAQGLSGQYELAARLHELGAGGTPRFVSQATASSSRSSHPTASSSRLSSRARRPLPTTPRKRLPNEGLEPRHARRPRGRHGAHPPQRPGRGLVYLGRGRRQPDYPKRRREHRASGGACRCGRESDLRPRPCRGARWLASLNSAAGPTSA